MLHPGELRGEWRGDDVFNEDGDETTTPVFARSFFSASSSRVNSCAFLARSCSSHNSLSLCW